MSLIYTSTQSTLPGGKRNSIYIGGRIDAKSFEKLQLRGVTHILNVTPSKDSSIQAGVPNFFEKSKQFTYKRIPVYDASTSTVELENQIPDIIKFISNALFHGSVLVHCQHGVSRSTTCVVLYLLSKAEMSLEDAIQLVKRRRPEAQPIPAFYELLQRYEKKLNNKRGADAGTEGKAKKKQKKSAGATGPAIGPSIGPATGPALGPAMPPTTTTNHCSTKKGIGPSIGPAMPPSSKETSAAKMIDASIGPAMAPSSKETYGKKAIGPAMLPPSKTKEIIGPALPPLSSTTIEFSAHRNEVIGPNIGPSTKKGNRAE